MNGEPLESPFPGKEPVEGDVGQGTEKQISQEENTSEVAPTQEPLAPSGGPHTEANPSLNPVEESIEETEGEVTTEIKEEENEEEKATGGEPPLDWFEPLEDDDDVISSGRNDGEEESLAGESEISESVAGSEKAFRKIYQ